MQSFGEGFGTVLSLDCKGNKTLSSCSVSQIGIHNHTHDSGVVCKPCVNCCDLSSSDETCLELTTSQTEQTTTLEASPVIMSDVLSHSSDALWAILGVTLVILTVVVIGWTFSCILMWKKMKGENKFDNSNQGYGGFKACLYLQQ